tara:strand:- start:17754 stop:18089 length:336 start_codon:yes stop_codon:yes gene_type:complete
MFAEESFLEKKFGVKFIKWSNEVPAFFPKSFSINKSKIKFSFKSVLRREYASFLSGISAMLFIDIVRVIILKDLSFLDLNKILFFTISVILVLILRTLKHHTNLLFEEGRS